MLISCSHLTLTTQCFVRNTDVDRDKSDWIDPAAQGNPVTLPAKQLQAMRVLQLHARSQHRPQTMTHTSQ